jgi:hypothetical protein
VALPPLSLTSGMAALRVLYNPGGGSLTVWFGDRRQEHVCEEVGEEEKHVGMTPATGRLASAAPDAGR